MTADLLLSLPPSIETERLILRPLKAGYRLLFLRALTESLPELRRFLSALPWIACEQTAKSAEIYCRNAHSNFVACKDLFLFVFERASGQLMGGVGLRFPV